MKATCADYSSFAPRSSHLLAVQVGVAAQDDLLAPLGQGQDPVSERRSVRQKIRPGDSLASRKKERRRRGLRVLDELLHLLALPCNARNRRAELGKALEGTEGRSSAEEDEDLILDQLVDGDGSGNVC